MYVLLSTSHQEISIVYLHLQVATSVPDPDFELQEEDDVFETAVEEGRAGLAQVEENAKSLEQHELQSAGLVKSMGRLSTAALSNEDSVLNGKFRSTLRTSSDLWENCPSCNGCHGEYIWKISGVSRKRKEARANPSTPLLSPPWYTGPHGYKLCTQLYLNGNGTRVGSHVSIFLSVMKGEFDPILPWPLRGRMSFCLLDLKQKSLPIVQNLCTNPNSSSFQQPSSKSTMNIASGCSDFAPLSTLDDERYVDDDEMFIKCIMDISS